MSAFVKDMEKAGIAVRPYAGRWFWKGPAVATNADLDLQDVIRATTVPLQWDQLGLHLIVYPVASDETWYAAAEAGQRVAEEHDDAREELLTDLLAQIEERDDGSPWPESTRDIRASVEALLLTFGVSKYVDTTGCGNADCGHWQRHHDADGCVVKHGTVPATHCTCERYEKEEGS